MTVALVLGSGYAMHEIAVGWTGPLTPSVCVARPHPTGSLWLGTHPAREVGVRRAQKPADRRVGEVLNTTLRALAGDFARGSAAKDGCAERFDSRAIRSKPDPSRWAGGQWSHRGWPDRAIRFDDEYRWECSRWVRWKAFALGTAPALITGLDVGVGCRA